MLFFVFVSSPELNEDWSFSINLKDFAEIPEENELDNDSPHLDMFQVKFLGSIDVESPKSEEETAAAIKKIVSQSKGKTSFFFSQNKIKWCF